MEKHKLLISFILLFIITGIVYSKNQTNKKSFSSVQLIRNKYRFLKLYNDYIKRKKFVYKKGKKFSIIIKASTKHILESKDVMLKTCESTKMRMESIVMNTSISGNTFIKAKKNVFRKDSLKIDLFGLSGEGIDLPFYLKSKNQKYTFYPGISFYLLKNGIEISYIGSFDVNLSYISFRKDNNLNLGDIKLNAELLFEALKFKNNFSIESLFSTKVNIIYYPFYLKAKIPIYSIYSMEKLGDKKFIKRKSLIGGIYLSEWLSIYGGYYESNLNERRGILGILTKF